MICRRARAGVTSALLCAAVLAGCATTSGRPADLAARPGTTAAPAATVSATRAVPAASPAKPTAAAAAPAAAPAAASASTPAADPKPPSPCVRNEHRQLVLVSVHSQHAWFCAAHAQVFDTPVTTGAVGLPYDATPTGTFHVQARQTGQVLTLLGGAQYTVKYWIPFDAPLFGFHDSPWQTMPYGSAHYRTKGSHGCVHVPGAAMRHLYRWVRVGATVRITP